MRKLYCAHCWCHMLRCNEVWDVFWTSFCLWDLWWCKGGRSIVSHHDKVYDVFLLLFLEEEDESYQLVWCCRSVFDDLSWSSLWNLEVSCYVWSRTWTGQFGVGLCQWSLVYEVSKREVMCAFPWVSLWWCEWPISVLCLGLWVVIGS